MMTGQTFAPSAVGLGGAPLAGRLGEVSAETWDEVVGAMEECGVSFIDTAASYGDGRAESRLGASLRRTGSQAQVCTKIRPGPGADNPTDHLAQQVERSCARLDRERIDLLLLHDPYDLPLEGLRGWLSALSDMRDTGMVNAIGVGASDPGLLTVLVASAHLDYVVCGRGYSLTDQSAAEDLFPTCLRAGTGVLLGGVFEGGVLATGLTPGARYRYQSRIPLAVRAVVQTATTVGSGFGVSLSDLAIRFAASHRAVTSVLVGTTSAHHLKGAAQAASLPLEPGMRTALDQAGILSPSAIP